jgi:perosamine synthetase
MTDSIPLALPEHGTEELEALQQVLESGQWSRGPQLPAFEQAMAELCHCHGGVGLASGTLGLQIAMEAMGIGPGDEVIAPSYTFVGTINAIARVGATAVLVDIEADTLNLDPKAVEQAISPRSKAIMAVHLFGRPAKMDVLGALARQHGLKVIEDACEAIGALYQGKPTGGLGDAGVFGFYPNKPVATGEGGMITANDPAFLRRCRQLRNQGNDTDTQSRHETLPGHSARLSEWHAALGRVQLARLQASLSRRAEVAGWYLEQLQTQEHVELPSPAAEGDTLAWFTFPLRIRGIHRQQRDRIMQRITSQGVACGPYFEPVHWLPYHRDAHLKAALPVTEDIGQRCLALPLFPAMTQAQVRRACDALLKAIAAER